MQRSLISKPSSILRSRSARMQSTWHMPIKLDPTGLVQKPPPGMTLRYIPNDRGDDHI